VNRQPHDTRARTIRRVVVVILTLTAVSAMFIYHGQYTAARIPNAQFAQQEFGGHFVYVRDAVLREIKAFIEQHGRTTQAR
jgi:hypothetical protein